MANPHSEKATYQQLKDLLTGRLDHLKSKLNVSNANLMVPTDGKGLRILASVPAGEGKPGHSTIECELSTGKTVSVDVEVHQDYEEVRPLN